MTKLAAADLCDLLARDLPGVLVPTAKRSEVTPAPPQHSKPATNLLATDDAVVQAQRIVEVALYLRDRLGYELLTNLTAVDFLQDDLIELVYHFSDLSSGVVVIKTRVDRDRATLPALTPHWPGADFQEREAYDLYGVVFEGHPHLQRIYMWDEFEGFPMRKDFLREGDKYFGETG